MPLDANGQYRHNHESAAVHSKQAGKSYNPGGDNSQKQEDSGDRVEIHAHGDGTFHTMHQGERVDHETHGHALIHAAKIHAEDGHKHFHAHHDGMAMHTHSVNAGEEPESRSDQDMEGAHGHLDESMNDEQGEDQAGQAEPEMAGKGLSGMY